MSGTTASVNIDSKVEMGWVNWIFFLLLQYISHYNLKEEKKKWMCSILLFCLPQKTVPTDSYQVSGGLQLKWPQTRDQQGFRVWFPWVPVSARFEDRLHFSGNEKCSVEWHLEEGGVLPEIVQSGRDFWFWGHTHWEKPPTTDPPGRLSICRGTTVKICLLTT